MINLGAHRKDVRDHPIAHRCVEEKFGQHLA
jgi:hypothetical protein